MNKINKIKKELKQELFRDPTREELIDRIEDPSLLTDIDHLYTIIRLDLPRTADGSADLHDIIEKPKEPSHEEKFSDFPEELQSVLGVFTDREQLIIKMYYGIGYQRTFNLREIGDKLNLTRERVRQIKAETLNKIKQTNNLSLLYDYL